METSKESMARPSSMYPFGLMEGGVEESGGLPRTMSLVTSTPLLKILVGLSYKQAKMDVLPRHSCLLLRTFMYISQTEPCVDGLQFDTDIKFP